MVDGSSLAALSSLIARLILAGFFGTVAVPAARIYFALLLFLFAVLFADVDVDLEALLCRLLLPDDALRP